MLIYLFFFVWRKPNLNSKPLNRIQVHRTFVSNPPYIPKWRSCTGNPIWVWVKVKVPRCQFDFMSELAINLNQNAAILHQRPSPVPLLRLRCILLPQAKNSFLRLTSWWSEPLIMNFIHNYGIPLHFTSIWVRHTVWLNTATWLMH